MIGIAFLAGHRPQIVDRRSVREIVLPDEAELLGQRLGKVPGLGVGKGHQRAGGILHGLERRTALPQCLSGDAGVGPFPIKGCFRGLGPGLHDEARVERADHVARSHAVPGRETADMVGMAMRGDEHVEAPVGIALAHLSLDVLGDLEHLRLLGMLGQAGRAEVDQHVAQCAAGIGEAHKDAVAKADLIGIDRRGFRSGWHVQAPMRCW